MFKSNLIRKSAVALLLVLFAASPVLGARRAARPDVLDLVAADSLFCLRINNFEKALGSVDEYIAGLSPMPIPLSMMARAPLGMMLGDPELKNVKTKGTFVIFGTVCCNSKSPSGKDLFVAGLIPVTDYDKFVKENAACGEPDDNGVSKISPPGPQGKKMLVKKVGAYAMVGPANGYDELIAAAKVAGKDSLGASLDRAEKRAARTSPFWARGNMQLAGKTFGPLVFAKVDEIKEQLNNMPKEHQPMGSPGEIMDMYVEMLKVVFDEVDCVGLSVTPSAEACKLAIDVSALEGKPLAEMLVPSRSARQENTLLPYLEDDAMMNLGIKINKPLSEKTYDVIYDVLAAIAKDGISDEDMAKLKKLTRDELESYGDSMTFSMSAEPGSAPPFEMSMAVDIADEAKYRTVLKDSLELINSGAIGDIYKAMGLKLDFQVTQCAAEYKGVSIDSAMLKFKTTDADSDMAKAIEALYGPGLDYRWALVDGLGLFSVGSDVDEEIRELIDDAKTGRKKQVASAVAEALATLGNTRRAEFVGTLNYVQAIKMGLGMAGQMDPKAANLGEIDMPTESSIAFAGHLRKGAMRLDIVLPKKHLNEIVGAIKQIEKKANEQDHSGEKKKTPPATSIEKPDQGLVADGAEVAKIADGFAFTEGPVADAEGNVYFSDIPNNKVHKYSARGKVTVHRDNTGGANGLYFDKNGTLYACAGGDRRVYFFCGAGRGTVAAEFDGKKLNSPNDLWIDPKGGIYFTDPRYGRNRDNMEQGGEHVYYILPGKGRDRKIIRVADDLVRPNGIIGTPCGKKLYIADHGGDKTYVYKIKPDGTLTDKKLFAEEGSDGLTIDSKGNIYLTNDAVKVYCCAGNKIATIEIPERPANVTFGGPDKKTLYITARKSLYAVKMNVKGL